MERVTSLHHSNSSAFAVAASSGGGGGGVGEGPHSSSSIQLNLKRFGSSSLLPLGETVPSSDASLLSGQKRSATSSEVDISLDIDSPMKRSASYDPTYSKAIDLALKDKEARLVMVEATNVFDCQSSMLKDQFERDVQALGIEPSSSSLADPIGFKHMSRLQRAFDQSMQNLINDNMRLILIDHLAKLADKQDIQLSTYFLSIHLLDMLLCKIQIPKNSFQLVGCVCLQLASKMDESRTPLIDDIIDASGLNTSVEAFLEMERNILDSLKFDLYIPTRYYFAERYAMAAHLSPKEKSMLIYILEFSFRDFSLNSVCMSKVVSAALHYTLQLLRPVKTLLWSERLVHYTGLVEDQLVPIIKKLRNLHWCVFTSKQAIYQEYDTGSHHYVSFVEAMKESDLRYDFQHNSSSGSPSSITSFASIDKL